MPSALSAHISTFNPAPGNAFGKLLLGKEVHDENGNDGDKGTSHH
jgi:hypothetical protein